MPNIYLHKIDVLLEKYGYDKFEIEIPQYRFTKSMNTFNDKNENDFSKSVYESMVQAYPNPANNLLKIEYAFVDSLSAGTYNVMVVDSNNCSRNFSFVVKQPQQLGINLSNSVLLLSS